MPPERIIFLHRLLEPSFCILAPYLLTFLGRAVCQHQLLFCQNLCKSIEKKARADLAPPPICHSAESDHVVLDLCRKLDWICEMAGFHIFQELLSISISQFSMLVFATSCTLLILASNLHTEAVSTVDVRTYFFNFHRLYLRPGSGREGIKVRRGGRRRAHSSLR